MACLYSRFIFPQFSAARLSHSGFKSSLLLVPVPSSPLSHTCEQTANCLIDVSAPCAPACSSLLFSSLFRFEQPQQEGGGC
ncbi:hypothetical protein Y1Q_0014443 [Alligator mississippiensis]|uniref:Uncharacterized protein n=1 Tax=Alligator mississippiensis TaxID=8496 RepID=A0A151PCL1_ALLMI|nr:hypothetical protein Y1Q_0014443 [Alligator mississippiensis]